MAAEDLSRGQDLTTSSSSNGNLRGAARSRRLHQASRQGADDGRRSQLRVSAESNRILVTAFKNGVRQRKVDSRAWSHFADNFKDVIRREMGEQWFRDNYVGGALLPTGQGSITFSSKHSLEVLMPYLSKEMKETTKGVRFTFDFQFNA